MRDLLGGGAARGGLVPSTTPAMMLEAPAKSKSRRPSATEPALIAPMSVAGRAAACARCADAPRRGRGTGVAALFDRDIHHLGWRTRPAFATGRSASIGSSIAVRR